MDHFHFYKIYKIDLLNRERNEKSRAQSVYNSFLPFFFFNFEIQILATKVISFRIVKVKISYVIICVTACIDTSKIL